MAIVKRADRITERSKQVTYFSDFKTDFDLFNYRDLQLTTNEQDVMQALHNLVMTNQGERLFNPLYGCDIRSLLFENITPQTESLLREKITVAIENFEPRAKIVEIITEGVPDENAYYVSLTFTTINKQEPITMDFILSRIR